MNQVRIYGDPFGDDAAASLLRSFLRLCLGNGMRCALSLAAVEPRPLQHGQRTVSLTDGVRDLQIGTCLPPTEIDVLMRAANEVAAATAPVLVFAPSNGRADVVREAGFAWPQATSVLAARDGATAADLLERVRAELRWAGSENPLHALEERELAPWLALPAVPAGGAIVCVVDDADADGADLAIAAWREHFAASGTPLRLVVTNGDAAVAESLRVACGEHGAHAEVLLSGFEPAHLRSASAVLLPWRRVRSTRVLVQALASGRPVCASRFAATAPLLATPGTCWPIGGVDVAEEPGSPAHFAPRPDAIAFALQKALEASQAAAIGRRARVFVGEQLVRGRPASPPPPVASAQSQLPVVVLEAPLFETSSSAELTIETARALCRRGRVEVRLVPTVPQRTRLAALRARAPELEARLCRQPGDADLWLSSGWPVRAARPPCRTWALRVDQEHGSLPLELTPHVSQEADAVVVHSEHVYRTLTAAGRPMRSIKLIPHGVDEFMHENAPPDPTILAWKGHRPAVLFCGGLIWRKGFDLFLQTVLAAKMRGADFAIVVKSIGHDQHYGGFHLGELLARFQSTAGTPPVMRIERELTRAELAGVYAACDVLVHPYRGEGFCLPVLEARACGLPVLATSGGATDALMVGPGATRIPSVRRSIELPAPHVSLPWIVEPSAEEAAKLLVSTLTNLAAAQRDARAFAPSVRTAFPWEAAAMAIEDLAFAALGQRRIAMPAEPVFTLPVAPARALAPVGAEPLTPR